MTLVQRAGMLLHSRRFQAACLAVLLALWVLRAVTMYRDPVLGGLFRVIGVDFGTYYIQASAIAAGKPEWLYSLTALEPFRHVLVAYTSDPATPLLPVAAPYPPLFAWLFSPLTSLSAPLAFALWTGLNVVLALALIWRVTTFFPASRRLVVAMFVLVSLPLALALWLGQVQFFLAIAVGEAFLALRGGRDLRAGVWLSALIIKPQYLILLGPLLLWKRRWKALGGLAAGAGLILGASALVAGPSSLAAYLGSILEKGGVIAGEISPNVFPEQMINWRALVLDAPGTLSSDMGLATTLILSGLTVVAILPALRGPWRPTSPRFAGQMTLLLVATMLVAYHSHGYGPLLLAVPLAAYLSGLPAGARAGLLAARTRLLDTGTRLAVGGGILAPTIWYIIGRTSIRSMNMIALALVANTALLVARLVLSDPLPDSAAFLAAADLTADLGPGVVR